MHNILLYAITVLIWGSTWFVITFQLGVVDPLVSIAYRFGLAAIILLAFLALRGRLNIRQFTPNQHSYIALQGFLLFSLNYWLFYLGTGHITSGLVAVIFSTMTLMNTFNQALIFKIPINKQVVLGSMIGLAGVSAVFWPEIGNMGQNESVLTGIWLCLGASYIASLGNMAALRNSRDQIPVLEGNSLGMAWGALFSFAIILITGKTISFDMSFDYIWSLFYLAILGSAVAFGCYLTLMKNIGADKAAYATVLFPIVALIISTLFEGYVWTPEAFIGMGLVVAGNVIAMTNREKMLAWRPNRAKKIVEECQDVNSAQTESGAKSPVSGQKAD